MKTDPDTRRGPLRVMAHAKLNLWLRVLAREESGFHSIETVLIRLELADRIELAVTPEPEIQLEVVGDRTVPGDATNLCWQAAEALSAEIGQPVGTRIRLEKRIPTGAGLGGGSADAAAVLHGLNELWGGSVDKAGLVRLAGDLGSDVPFGLCETSMAMAWERGRRLLPLDAPPFRHVLIVVPGYPIGAAEAYGWLAADRADGHVPSPGPALHPGPAELSKGAVFERGAINDLAGPVFRRHPDLARIRDSLEVHGADVALLCGSGSCVAGVFAEESALANAAEVFDGVQGLSTIRTRTLG
ncbi:MAG: 4-(cytidine 5'-diphospho)-2-C-methyl-D-erythritol kinase [Gemmatimonadetes bacterium]|nr:4-(cytidine 5'-diphospho)-2-C-methyl-D-erythritol kinase [Gemmatimonadota bacterium]